MARSTLTSKGQITIPKQIRDRFGLGPGDVLEFREDDEGRIEVRISDRIPGVLGSLRHRAQARPVTVEAMRSAVRERAAERHRKSQ